MNRRLSLFAFSLVVGCSGADFNLAPPGDETGDAGVGGDTGAQPDAGPDTDAGPDSSVLDAGPDGSDASDGDAGPEADAGPDGSGGSDAGPVDAGPDGSGGSDAGPLDAGPDGSDAGDGGDADADAGPFCIPSAKRCSGISGLTPQTCDVTGTSWVDGAPCPLACLDGVCVTCAPGKMKCSGSVPQLCDGTGNWTSKPACSGGTPICLSGTCYECTPGDDRCTGVGPSPKYEVCGGGGTWGSTTCTFGCTAGVGCTGTCVPGTKKCGTVPYMGGTASAVLQCDPTGNWASIPLLTCLTPGLLKCDSGTFTCVP